MTALHTDTVIRGWDVRSDDERVTLIRNLVFESINDPLVLWTARKIVERCRSRDENCEVRTLYSAVKKGPIPLPRADGGVVNAPALKFVEDVRFRDTFPTAGKILEWLADGANGEDCDGHVILTMSLATCLGYQPGVVIVALENKDSPYEIEYVHIFGVVGVPRTNPTKWIAMDTTVPSAYPGWLPPPVYGVKAMRLYALHGGKLHGQQV